MTAVEDPELSSTRGDVTHILARFSGDRDAATNELLPVVYSELRRLAAGKLARESGQNTLQPTALVHEAYLRLMGARESTTWQNRRHFFGAAAEAMRRILVDAARAKSRLKRRNPERFLESAPRQSSDGSPVKGLRGADALEQAVSNSSEDLLLLDVALDRLAEADPVKAELVKLKFFAGLTMAEAAEALQLSLRTAEREWSFARVWLHREIEGTG